MFAKLPQRERDLILEYCKGVNDTIDAIYAGSLPEPLEVNILRNCSASATISSATATNISDQVDPFYAPPGGAWPNAGFQFTPEMAVSIAILEVRNFGLDELRRGRAPRRAAGADRQARRTRRRGDLGRPQLPQRPAGAGVGARPDDARLRRSARRARRPTAAGRRRGERFPRYDYAGTVEPRRAAAEARREPSSPSRLGAWPMLGSYAWVIAGNKSATGYPWLGGFPQTGIQTPSIMHFVENRSAEGTSNRIPASAWSSPARRSS